MKQWTIPPKSPAYNIDKDQQPQNGGNRSSLSCNKENTFVLDHCKDDFKNHEDNSSNTTRASYPFGQKGVLSPYSDTRRSLELEKIERHKLQAAEDIERYKKEKMQREKEKEEEKRRDLRMLTEFYPWGTTTGRFERGDFRKQKWELSNFNQRNWNNSRVMSSQSQPNVEAVAPCQNNNFQHNNEMPDIENYERNGKFDPSNKEQGKNTETETPIQNSDKENAVREKSEYYDTVWPDKSSDTPRQESSCSGRYKRNQSPTELMRARAARVYMEELKKGMEEQKKRKEELKREYNAPVGDLAAVMGMGKVGKPRRDPYTGILLDNHLRISDVSKNKMGYQVPEDPKLKSGYCSDLITAAEERYRLRELEKLKLLQQEKQHQETFNNVWGRPGGGAPRNHNLGNRISNLNQIFYKSDQEMNGPSQHTDDMGFHKIREKSLRLSSHQNCYDYPSNKKNFKEYSMRTPWANFY